MADEDKDWLVEISSPIFPTGLRATRLASMDEMEDLLKAINIKLPEWRVNIIDINRTMRDLDRTINHDRKSK